MHPLIESGMVCVKGPYESHFEPFEVAQLVYTGMATFWRTGREQRVYYYESVRIPKGHQPDPFFEMAIINIERTMRWSERGVLRNWLSPRAFRSGKPHHRYGVSVKWDRWNEAKV